MREKIAFFKLAQCMCCKGDEVSAGANGDSQKNVYLNPLGTLVKQTVLILERCKRGKDVAE